MNIKKYIRSWIFDYKDNIKNTFSLSEKGSEYLAHLYSIAEAKNKEKKRWILTTGFVFLALVISIVALIKS
jgi:hypothetical protein